MESYLAARATTAAGTRDAYRRVLRDFAAWLVTKPGYAAGFAVDQFTHTAVTLYLDDLQTSGYSRSHRARVKAVFSGFARYLIDEHGMLRRNPTRGITLPPVAALAPRELTSDQRFVLRTLVERAGTPRGAALFALGYWAGCRVSDIAWLDMAHLHLSAKAGWMTVGHKGGKQRTLDLHPAARRPLAAYLAGTPQAHTRPYVFSSQRSARLTEAGIHYWFRSLKAQATKTEWDLLAPITFHDLRHDFAHRARAAGWSLEEVAYYLGHLTKMGTPAIQTTVRYTQVSRDHVKPKLHQIRG